MSKMIATRNAYKDALVALGEKNENVVVLDADLAKSTMTYDFSQSFPQRFFSIGIAEANMTGIAAGLAAAGKIPFASTFAIFATGRAYEQIRNSIAYPNLNVKIAATHAGITVGEDGASHQSVEDIGLMRGIPNMSVICPADGPETVAAVMAAAEHQGPVYLRMGRAAVPVITEEEQKLEWGKAKLLRQGQDVSILTTGMMTALALQAAEILAAEGIEAEVLHLPFIKPLDEEAVLATAAKTKRVVTAEEHSIINGLGSAVAEVLSEKLPTPLRRVGIKDTFGESGKPADLLIKYGLTPEEIVKKAKELI
ncbi:MAG: transketolase family protein [Firmicutes bacterium]|jgi:transketolase|nr:transketolase family protein [Bacillota bacterium]